MYKKRVQQVRAVSIEPTVLAALTDPDVAAAYIQDCLKEPTHDHGRLLLRALMNVARAQKVRLLAKGSESRRRLIYKALSDDGNPSIHTLESILNEMGLTIDIRPLKKAS